MTFSNIAATNFQRKAAIAHRQSAYWMDKAAHTDACEGTRSVFRRYAREDQEFAAQYARSAREAIGATEPQPTTDPFGLSDESGALRCYQCSRPMLKGHPDICRGCKVTT